MRFSPQVSKENIFSSLSLFRLRPREYSNIIIVNTLTKETSSAKVVRN